MAINLINYTNEMRFTKDYDRVHNFLVRINQNQVITPNFLWGRWEWMFSLPFLDERYLDRIGLWENDGEIVALATYESKIGEAYVCIDPTYSHLKKSVFEYAANHLQHEGSLKMLIANSDRTMQRIAGKNGFRPTQNKECVAMIDITANLSYNLPAGFRVTSLADDFDLKKLNSVLWKGFNHGDTPSETEQDLLERKISCSGPHLRRELNIAVVAPSGEFVSYCGMWYLPGSDYAYVEPVATVPAYRKMGLGKAAVLEAVKRCGQLGAKKAFVGSSQQFYYNIGFYPIRTETWWARISQSE